MSPERKKQSSIDEHERLDAALRNFREGALAETEHPDQFWDRQRLSIHERAAQPRAVPNYRRTLMWATAAAAVALVWAIFTNDRAQPAPDFVAGYDQELLTTIHNLVRREAPKALDPARLLIIELERAAPATPKK
jgi:hypothetical protein